jgi:thioesterase domain-containing protein
VAADCLSLIRRIQPTGPYNLLGWSFGGLVAHAVATQLQSMGEEIALLAILDSYPPRGEKHDRERSLRRSEVTDDAVREMLGPLRREGEALSIIAERHYQAIRDTFENNVRLMAGFKPGRFDGDVLFFAATDGEPRPPSPEVWRRYVNGRIKIRGIDCRHNAMMDAGPAAKIGSDLAAELNKQPTTREGRGAPRDQSI